MDPQDAMSEKNVMRSYLSHRATNNTKPITVSANIIIIYHILVISKKKFLIIISDYVAMSPFQEENFHAAFPQIQGENLSARPLPPLLYTHSLVDKQ